MNDNHDHKGIDSVQLDGRSFINAPFPAITDISGTASGTYSANEQTIINDERDAINFILQTLRDLKLIRE